MKHKLLFLTALLLSFSSCVVPSINFNPKKPPVIPTVISTFSFDLVACHTAPVNNYCEGVAGAQFKIGTVTATGDSNGYAFVASALAADGLTITAQGYKPFTSPVSTAGLQTNNATGAHNFFLLVEDVPPLPAPPTRDQILRVCTTFQGLTVQTVQYGSLPWFEAGLFSLSPADRKAVYQAKHASTACAPGGDTHAIIQFDSNSGSIYDEPNQPYQQFNGPAFGNHLPDFVKAVEEVVSNGFSAVVFMDERQAESTRLISLAINALKNSSAGDLTRYVVFLPGWDGVFYGWDPKDIAAWSAQARTICPACYLGLEFNTGHIPLGEGDKDYLPGGRMQDFDILFVEFDGNAIHGNNTWGILARLLGPGYHRPADDTQANNGNDSNPRPWVLRNPNPRGPWAVNCFEFNEYEWVRSRVSLADLQAKRAYLFSIGCPVVN